MREEEIFQKLLQLVQCRGAEDPPPKENEGSEDEDDEDEDEGDQSGKEGQGDKPKGESDTDNLVKTLKKERADRKKFERELRQLRAAQEAKDTGDQSEAEKARTRAEAAEAKAQKLAVRLANQAVDIAISRFASKLKFKDPEDALVHVARDLENWVDQDPDDPSVIEVDEAAVERAVKELAGKKKYLLDAEGEKEASGSKFGGKKNDDGTMSEEKLREKYPALRR